MKLFACCHYVSIIRERNSLIIARKFNSSVISISSTMILIWYTILISQTLGLLKPLIKTCKVVNLVGITPN